MPLFIQNLDFLRLENHRVPKGARLTWDVDSTVHACRLEANSSFDAFQCNLRPKSVETAVQVRFSSLGALSLHAGN